MTIDTNSPVRITNHKDLISIIPHLLSFTPKESLVAVALNTRPMAARLDLADAADTEVHDMLLNAWSGQADKILLVAYSNDPAPTAALRQFQAAMIAGGLVVEGVYLLTSSVLIRLDLTVGGTGHPVALSETLLHTTAVADMTIRGVAPLPDRELLGKVVDDPEAMATVAQEVPPHSFTALVHTFQESLEGRVGTVGAGIVMMRMNDSKPLRDMVLNLCVGGDGALDMVQNAAATLDGLGGSHHSSWLPMREALAKCVPAMVNDDADRPSEHTRHAIEVLHAAMSATPHGHRSEGLGVLALLTWWDGRLVEAAAYAEQATADAHLVNKNADLASIIAPAIRMGQYPAWTDRLN